MTKFKSLTIWTVVLNLLILVGAGHGLACMGLLEVAGIFNKFEFNTEYFSISLTAGYDKSLGMAAILCLAGQIFLLLSLFLKKKGAIIWTRMAGLVFLWVGFYYLIHNFFNNTDDSGSQLAFYTGIPFMIVSVRLAYKTLKLERLEKTDDAL